MAQTGYAIIDIGTSSMRVSLITRRMQLHDSAVHTRAAGPEIDARAEWTRVSMLTRELMERHPDFEVAAMCCSSMLGWVALDARGEPVHDAFTWMDQRPEQMRDFFKTYDKSDFHKRTLRRASAELGALKLLWLRQHKPDACEATRSLVTLKDYINLQLTGETVLDTTSSSYTGIVSVERRDYDDELVAAMGLTRERLAPLRPSYEVLGPLREDVARELLLPAGVPVLTSAPDGSMALLGAGGTKMGTSVCVMGTTSVFFSVSKTPVYDSTQALVVNPHVIPDLYMVGGMMGMTGGALGWFAQDFLEGRYSLRELDEQAAALPPGAGGVMFIPSLTGERSPFWNAAVRGTVCGLTPQHKPAHLFRALMEGNCYSIKRIAEITQQNGLSVEQIIAIGGGSKSPVWMQLKADITNTPVVAYKNIEATTMGCAALCLHHENGSLGAPFWNEELRRYTPDPERVARYEELFSDYLVFMNASIGLYTGLSAHRAD